MGTFCAHFESQCLGTMFFLLAQKCTDIAIPKVSDSKTILAVNFANVAEWPNMSNTMLALEV